MRLFLLAALILIALLSNAQCVFPEEYNSHKVKEIVAHKGKVYMNVKSMGFVLLTDSIGTYNIISYEKTPQGNFAKLSCGATIPNEQQLPKYIYQENVALHPGIYLKKSGGFMLGGVAISAVSFGVGALLLKNGDTSTPGLVVYGIGGGTGALFTLIGMGMLVKAGNHFIRLDAKGSKKLELGYYGTSASLRLRF